MAQQDRDDKRESGLSGGGRKDETGGSGVYTMSVPHPPTDVILVVQEGWDQGERGIVGYEDHGESGVILHKVTERCRDIMTRDLACCLRTDSTAKAAQVMMEHDVGILPVVESGQDKNLLGVVTDRDLAVTVVAHSQDPSFTSVDSIMSRSPIVCSPDDHYEKVLHIMERRQIRRVPVVDYSGRIVGMISQADIASRVGDTKRTGEVVKQISRPTSA